MSTPVDLNIVMPYGVTVDGAGSRNARIVTNSTQASSDIALKLPDGPCRVAASWDGPESVRLTHQGHGYPVVIPAGGGIAPGWLPSARPQGRLSTSKTCRAGISQRAGAALSRCTRSTSSSAPQGGGLGDHPEHQHRRGHGRATGNQIVRSSDRGRERQSDRRGEFLPRSAGGRFDADGLVAADRTHGPSDDLLFGVESVRHSYGEGGGDAGAVEHCCATGGAPLPERSGEWRGRRGRNHHHLPTRVAAGGVR